MKYYEYDVDGWWTGWHTEAGRARSTEVAPVGIPPRRARWSGAAWVDDGEQETREVEGRQTKLGKRRAARNALRDFDPDAATPEQVRAVVGVLVAIALSVIKEE